MREIGGRVVGGLTLQVVGGTAFGYCLQLITFSSRSIHRHYANSSRVTVGTRTRAIMAQGVVFLLYLIRAMFAI